MIKLIYLILITAISSSTLFGKDEEFKSLDTIQIGGIQQVVSINYVDKDKPLLLFLHGGPGRSLMNYSDNFNNKLKENFIVVHWDQRETGRTLKLNRTNEVLSLELLVSDTYEIINYLITKYNKKKIYLASHSWGSEIGFMIASKFPELVKAYMPISAVINQQENTRIVVPMLKEWAEKENNMNAINELAQITIPISSKRDLYLQQKWLFVYNGENFSLEPGFRAEYFEWMDIWFPLILEASKKNMFDKVAELDCPVYFIEGNGDNHKTHKLVEEYFKFLSAKEKEMFWFEKSGHTVFNTEPEKLQDVIIEIFKKLETK